MADNSLSQITDAVASTNLKVVGEAPAISLATVYQALSNSVSLSIQVTQVASDAVLQLGVSATALAVKKISDLMKGS